MSPLGQKLPSRVRQFVSAVHSGSEVQRLDAETGTHDDMVVAVALAVSSAERRVKLTRA